MFTLILLHIVVSLDLIGASESFGPDIIKSSLEISNLPKISLIDNTPVRTTPSVLEHNKTEEQTTVHRNQKEITNEDINTSKLEINKTGIKTNEAIENITAATKIGASEIDYYNFEEPIYVDGKTNDSGLEAIAYKTRRAAPMIHCIPFYTEVGEDSQLPEGKYYNYNSPKLKNLKDIHRLIYLLKRDVSNYTSEQLSTFLGNLAKIKLDLYNYNFASLKLLLNTIIPGKSHTFLNLNKGIVRLFNYWNLDVSGHMDKIKRAMMVVRPPCRGQIKVQGRTGSTRSQRYTIVPFSKNGKAEKKEQKECAEDEKEDSSECN